MEEVKVPPLRYGRCRYDKQLKTFQDFNIV